MNHQSSSMQDPSDNKSEDFPSAYQVARTQQLVEKAVAESGLPHSQSQGLWQALWQPVQRTASYLQQIQQWLQTQRNALVERLRCLRPTQRLSRSEWLALAMAAGLMVGQASHPFVAQAADPIGSEFRVANYSTFANSNAAVGMDSDGDFVIVWSARQDGSVGIYAQQYNASGSAQGSEFKVNPTTDFSGDQAIGMDSDGNFVIVWTDFNSRDGDNSGIYAQRYDVSGAAQGSEFKVNSYTTSAQRDPAIGMASDGDFVIAWEDFGGQDGSNGGVYAQRYSASGSTVGTEFQVNSYTTGDQTGPAIGMDSDGSFVIAWEDFGGQDGSSSGVYAQRYNASGSTIGAEFKVNSYTTDIQRAPSVGMDSDGDFVVAWQSGNYSGVGQDGSLFGVYAQRYDASGSTVGTEFKVNTYTTHRQYNPSVGMDSDGDFVVVWNDFSGQDGSSIGVYAQQYNASGEAQGSEFLVNTHTTDAQSSPGVGMDGDGNFVIAWISQNQDGSQWGTYAQRYGLTPEISVIGNGQEIVDGDSSPTTADYTDFGEMLLNSSLTRTFTISNSGTMTLTVETVSLSGTHASDFSISQQPTSPIAVNGSTTFEITFTPAATGTRTAEVSFTNNDNDETPYNFTIQGTGSGQLQYLPIISKG